jgi:hypothetical protein
MKTETGKSKQCVNRFRHLERFDSMAILKSSNSSKTKTCLGFSSVSSVSSVVKRFGFGGGHD